jgi:hypothetical protein
MKKCSNEHWSPFLGLSLKFSYFRHSFKGNLLVFPLPQQALHTECALVILQFKFSVILEGETHYCAFHTQVRLSLSGNYLMCFPSQSLTRNYFIFMVRRIKERTPRTVILELKLDVRLKMFLGAM